MCGLGSFKEALQGQTPRREQQGWCGPHTPAQTCLAATEHLGGLLGGILPRNALGVDVMGKDSCAQSWLRAPVCWRLAQVIVPEGL